MASNKAFVLRLVSSSVAVANQAGRIIRKIMKTGSLGVVDKGTDGEFDPQTEADRASQRCIIGSLLKSYPNLKIIGEEEGIVPDDMNDELQEISHDKEVLSKCCPSDLASVGPEDVVVWVDPVDGTKEFTEGLYEQATVLIGISMNGKPIAGVIHQPFYGFGKEPEGEPGRTVWGIRGLGAFGFTYVTPPAGRCIITTTRSHSTKLAADAIEAMKPDKVIKAGGAGFKVILLLEGDADAYVFASPGCKRWDTCACEAILEALGGTLTDVCGEHITYDEKAESYMNKTGVLATLRDHEVYTAMIPEEVKSAIGGKR